MKKTMLVSGLVLLMTTAWSTKEDAVSRKTTTAAIHTENAYHLNTFDMESQESNAVEVVNKLFDAFKTGASPTDLAAFYAEDAVMDIPGDIKTVPWIGKRRGRAQIAEHYRLLKEYIKPEKLEFIDMLDKGNRVVLLGYLESRNKKNNKVMKSYFSINIVVEDGKVKSYHLLEDSFEVANKVR